ncbi:hypothetical protein AB0D78_45235 [Streptomyces avermitilis]|uniref:hypothetical protein n=1 Tax=Streptomyces avermitilis TaxID=33903 RepID=UPI0033FB3634
MSAGTVLDLSAHRDNAGCALPGIDTGSGLDGLGRAFPADELRGLEALVGGFPAGWGTGVPDNVECLGQPIVLPTPLRVGSVGILGACTGGSYQDELVLEGTAGQAAERAVPLALTDWLAASPHSGESCAAVCSHVREHGREIQGPRPRLWRYEAELAQPYDTVVVRLPVNPDIHIFGLWVRTDPPTESDLGGGGTCQ